MHTKENILGNTLEGMAADAEDHGKPSVLVNLSFEDIKMICAALGIAENQRKEPACDKPHNEFEETVPLMLSPDYKERFKAEVYQLDIRIDKLAGMLSAWNNGELKFQPACSYVMLETQLNAMKVYRHLLQMRAEIEGIALYECEGCKHCAHAHQVGDITYECDANTYDLKEFTCFIPKRD
jgi:hypothetical protein